MKALATLIFIALIHTTTASTCFGQALLDRATFGSGGGGSALTAFTIGEAIVLSTPSRTTTEVGAQSGQSTITAAGDAIESQPNALVHIFPNPATDRLHIQLANGKQLQPEAVRLLDIMGRQIGYFYKIVGNTIEIDGLANGPYLIQIETSTGPQSIRFIKTSF